MTKISRRDALKLGAAAVSAAALSGPLSRLTKGAGQGSLTLPNIIVLVFDAMSARNLSLYGYPRKTSPNFERFAERATVYHSHNSGGNFTTPGTASLLTGMYPWTHRAVNHAGLVRRDLVDRNIFALLGDEYFRTGFAQTGFASILLTQFKKRIDQFLSATAFSEASQILGDKLPDAEAGYLSIDDFMLKVEKAPSSLVMGSIARTILYSQAKRLSQAGYPRGIPKTGQYPVYFKLDEVFSALTSMLKTQATPRFSYIHVFPPHAPYSPRRGFYGMFRNDNYFPPAKPIHKLSDHQDARKVYIGRMSYDEYVATVDDEFGKFMKSLDSAGILDNSYLFITSDHGELMERGDKGHDTPLLYDPVIHSPLLVSVPGDHTHRDIYAPTNNVDLLPTILHIAGKAVPDWCEGQVLPGLGGAEDYQRSTFTVEAKTSSAFSNLPRATIAMRKGTYKMIYFHGYNNESWFELYNHENDLEEMNDLFKSEPAVAGPMKDELLERFNQANREYEKR